MRIRLLVCFTLLLLFPAYSWATELSCQLSTNEVEVGLEPSDDSIMVYGRAPSEEPVVIKVEGPQRPVLVSLYPQDSFMKFSEAEVLGLPGYYQVLTSLPTEGIDEKYRQGLGVSADYQNLKTDAWVRMRQYSEEVYHRNQQDYINLAVSIQEQKHFYDIRQAVVKRNGQDYRVEIPLVAGMPLGQMKITALTVANDKIITSNSQILNLKPASLLAIGSQELSISAVMVISLFMIPILLLTVAQILEAIELRKEQERRARMLREICHR